MESSPKAKFLTGVLANLSASGALLTNPGGSLEIGEKGQIRLMDLREVLRTAGAETITLKAEVVRKEIGGYGLRFLGDRAELEALLERAFGRGAIDYA